MSNTTTSFQTVRTVECTSSRRRRMAILGANAPKALTNAILLCRQAHADSVDDIARGVASTGAKQTYRPFHTVIRRTTCPAALWTKPITVPETDLQSSRYIHLGLFDTYFSTRSAACVTIIRPSCRQTGNKLWKQP